MTGRFQFLVGTMDTHQEHTESMPEHSNMLLTMFYACLMSNSCPGGVPMKMAREGLHGARRFAWRETVWIRGTGHVSLDGWRTMQPRAPTCIRGPIDTARRRRGEIPLRGRKARGRRRTRRLAIEDRFGMDLDMYSERRMRQKRVYALQRRRKCSRAWRLAGG